MKTIKYAATAFGLLALTILSQVPAFAAEGTDVMADHKVTAASYREKAAAQDTLIAEHQGMQGNYEKRYQVTKAGPWPVAKEMGEHCDKIIQAAQLEKQALLDFAKWHEMRAAELQGQ